ncbi:hypothetical protein M427DRAFT_158893 [Gonapodya prolifera JEL478]|uniref:Uncharacterized protein n=1 Tax=Gonapodya prolifera (strain JEL478) TaxID=1344416 RepID=A0A139A2F1_GONPJ|nr:hypothetical protein M427DRAFT_158893 [Gonapodya prolifera JEL478]|eukprot:KXS10725.1 hypothetical protein M427DRAFT_158893 [Gonapodya prolifera JEL478]
MSAPLPPYGAPQHPTQPFSPSSPMRPPAQPPLHPQLQFANANANPALGRPGMPPPGAPMAFPRPPIPGQPAPAINQPPPGFPTQPGQPLARPPMAPSPVGIQPPRPPLPGPGPAAGAGTQPPMSPVSPVSPVSTQPPAQFQQPPQPQQQQHQPKRRMYPGEAATAYAQSASGPLPPPPGQEAFNPQQPGMAPVMQAPPAYQQFSNGPLPPSFHQQPGPAPGGAPPSYQNPLPHQQQAQGQGLPPQDAKYPNVPSAYASQTSLASVNDVAGQVANLSLGGVAAQVPTVSVFGASPYVQELEGAAGLPWIAAGSSASTTPTSHPHPSYKTCTLEAAPASQAILNKSKLPFALVVTPYRVPAEGEPPVPIINPEQIVRCRRCRTYINPWVQFVEQGTRWRCNLCYLTNEVPSFFDWDSETRTSRNRLDRPELTHSCVEFVAPQEYMVRPPQPCVFVFVIDVSFAAVASGMVATAARTILDSLDGMPNEDNRTKVAIVTVDSALHFYNLNSALSDPQMLVVGDLDDPFIPQPEDLLVNLSESRTQIEALLSRMGDMFRNTQQSQSALGGAVQVVFKMLQPIGGKIVVLQSSLPSVGPGALKAREDPKLLGTPKEVTLLNPASMFYKQIAVDCSRAQVSVDVWLFGSGYNDVATLSGLAKHTGGSTYYYPGFSATRPDDAIKFATEFSHFLTKPLGLEAVLRVRASRGIKMTSFHGNFFLRSTDLLALPNVNPDACYVIEMEIEETLQSGVACFQTAVLHTSSNGERRIRVVTLALPVTNQLGDLFAAADVKAVTTVLAKKAVERSLDYKLEDARDALVNKCADIFSAFKAQSGGGGASAGQLLIPSNLKLLPLLTLATLKNIAFRPGPQIPSDLRSSALALMYHYPLEMVIATLHPRLYALHVLPPQAGLPGSDGLLVLPPMMNLGSDRLERHGVYLLDNGREIFLYVSKLADPQLIQALFGVQGYDAVATGKSALPALQNDYSIRVQAIIGKIRQTRLTMFTTYPHFYVVKEDADPALRMLFMSHLIEDRIDSVWSYSQFLGHLREIVAK